MFHILFVNVHPFRVWIIRETSLKNTFNHYHEQAPRSQSCKLILNALNVKTLLDNLHSDLKFKYSCNTKSKVTY